MADKNNIDDGITQINRDNDFKGFLKKDIPIISRRPKTFLGIARQPHYENVLSNILAFYFNVEEEHGLNNLFIESLVECINKRLIDSQLVKIITPIDFIVETEVLTDNGGRIDLLLSNDNQAIIIENKVYHYLNNDLSDYYDSIKFKDAEFPNKIGVILSLKKVSNITHQYFYNITHFELLNAVMNNIGQHLMDANDKYVTYLKDLFQNIKNLSQPNMTEEAINFYLDNKESIAKAIRLKKAMLEYMVSEFEKIGTNLENTIYYAPKAGTTLSKRARYYLSSANKNLMIVLVFENILSTNEVFLGVELKGNLLINKEQYKDINFTEEEVKMIGKTDFYSNSDLSWAHFAGNTFVVTDNDILDLSEFILKTLEENHLISIFKKLEAYLVQN